jgi:hypothetical protein
MKTKEIKTLETQGQELYRDSVYIDDTRAKI